MAGLGALVALVSISQRPLRADPAASDSLRFLVDGYIETATTLGNTLYVGGLFNGVAPADNAVGPVFALSEATGDIVAPQFPPMDGSVGAIEPDGAGGYFLEGSFTTIGTLVRPGLAHVFADGSLDPLFAPPTPDAATYNGFALTRRGTTLYVAGGFSAIGGVPRGSVAALDATTGALLPWAASWTTPTPDNVFSVAGRVIIAGTEPPSLPSLGPRARLAAFDGASGALLWDTGFYDGSAGSAVTVSGNKILAPLTTSRFPIFSGAYVARDVATGAELWRVSVVGSLSATVDVAGTTVFIGGSFTSVAGQSRRGFAAIALDSGTVLPWSPTLPDGFFVGHLTAASSGFVYAYLWNLLNDYQFYRIDSGGGVDTSWQPDVLPNGVSEIRDGAPGSILIASSVTATGYVPRNSVAAFDLVTGQLLPWNPVNNGGPRLVDFLAAGGSRVYIGRPFRSQQVVDAVTGADVGSVPVVNVHVADETALYTLEGFAVQKRFLATGSLDPAWQPLPGGPSLAAFDPNTLYLLHGPSSSMQTLTAIDRRSGRLRWSIPTAGRLVRGLAVTGDTLLVGIDDADVETVDARTGAYIGPLLGASGAFALAIADGRVIASRSSAQSGYALTAAAFDGRDTGWSPRTSGWAKPLVAANRLIVFGSMQRFPPNALRGATVFPLTGPKAPSALRARPKGAATEFTWTAPAMPPSGGYVLEAGTTAGQLVPVLPVGQTSSFSMVVPPGTYFVRVKTVGAVGGVEEVSNQIRVVGGCALAPPPPTSLVASVTDGAVSLTWEPPDALVDSYTLTAGSGSAAVDIAAIALGGAQTSLTAAPPPGTYYLRVAATNACGSSAPSGEVFVTVGSGVSLPAAPTNLLAGESGSTVAMSWTAPPGPVTGYQFEAGTDLGRADVVAVTLGTVTALSVPGVPTGRYLVRVRAINAGGTGPPSGDVVVRVP